MYNIEIRTILLNLSRSQQPDALMHAENANLATMAILASDSKLSMLKRRRVVTTLTVLGDRDDGGGGRGAEGDFHALRDKVDERGVAPAELAVG